MAYCPTFTVHRTLVPHDPPIQGQDVLAVQEALCVRGFYRGPRSGAFCPETIGAVQAMQRASAVLPTGIVNKPLARALSVMCVLRRDCLACLPQCVHLTRPGETMFSIAAMYGWLPQDLMAVNQHIPGPRELAPGTKVMMPNRRLTGIGYDV